MKKIVLVFLVLVFANQVYAQFTTLTPYKPNDSDALKKAAAQAAADGLKNPVLKLIGSMNGTVPIQGMEVDLTVDLKKGTSSAWMYVYSDEKGDSSKSYAVAKLPFLGFQVFPFPFSMFEEVLPFNPSMGLNGFSWKSTDVYYDLLVKDSEYKQFVADRPDYKLDMIGLGVNTENSMFDMNKPYWLMVFSSGGGNLTCFMHAETGVSLCLGFWGVEDGNVVENLPKLSPVPANDKLHVNFKNLPAAGSKVYVIDMQGREVKSELLDGSEEFMLDVSDLQSGSYTLIYVSDNIVRSVPLIINR